MTDDRIDETELERYGIKRVPADVFEWGGYRYSNARDALAAAKRNGAKADTQAQGNRGAH